ncbi:MAG TPA: NAD(P)/FAD-dependent oxidoreductase [Frankiaceae bacterium]|jgi:cation diffusion facilitator CzcD-associated flavoprotein CzcO|nr:NAD(P)/FAD-dependent oxidoreductase [Frankiaceae bacterium]
MVAAVQTLVIGASASGLATAAELRQRGLEFEIIEAEPVVASAWRRHYDRLHLHTPKAFSALPGLPMPKSYPRYPSREQVVEYLESYQRHFCLEPHFGERVQRVERVDGTWETTTNKGVRRSANVIIATGRTRVPMRPTWPGMEQFHGDVLHSSEFRNGDAWKGRPVLVVGFGNSACEQALDLVERGAQVHLAVRSPVNVLPRDILGVLPVLPLGIVMRHLPPRVADVLAGPMIKLTIGDVTKVGLRKLPYGPNAQIAHDRHVPLLDIGTIEQIKQGHITVHGGVERFTADGVRFTDGTELAVAAVVLATGYRAAVQDFLIGWEAVCDGEGTPTASGAPTALEGLYFCGMYVSPAGMLREIRLEAVRLSALIEKRPVPTS